MNTEQPVIRWSGREKVHYRLGSLAADVDCYFDPARNSYLAVLRNMGVRHGQIVRLSTEEMNAVEKALREWLGVKRLFGIRVGTCEVRVEREQHAF